MSVEVSRKHIMGYKPLPAFSAYVTAYKPLPAFPAYVTAYTIIILLIS